LKACVKVRLLGKKYSATPAGIVGRVIVIEAGGWALEGRVAGGTGLAAGAATGWAATGMGWNCSSGTLGAAAASAAGAGG
jgi:hypothetical protein